MPFANLPCAVTPDSLKEQPEQAFNKVIHFKSKQINSNILLKSLLKASPLVQRFFQFFFAVFVGITILGWVSSLVTVTFVAPHFLNFEPLFGSLLYAC
jgi:hypothetical protein